MFKNVHVWMEKRLCVIVDFKMENIIRQCGCLDRKQIVCGKVAFEWGKKCIHDNVGFF